MSDKLESIQKITKNPMKVHKEPKRCLLLKRFYLKNYVKKATFIQKKIYFATRVTHLRKCSIIKTVNLFYNLSVRLFISVQNCW